MTKRASTPNRGAADTRHEILDAIERSKMRPVIVTEWAKAYNAALDSVAKFVRGMAKRASARPGGLGRRKAKR